MDKVQPSRPYPTSLDKYSSRETGAMRESIGTKTSTRLVPYELTIAAAIGLNYGEQKYGARNFEKGLAYSDLLGSIERHTEALKAGEFVDEDSGVCHFHLLASSVAMLCHNIMQGVVIDDRPPQKIGRPISELSKKS